LNQRCQSVAGSQGFKRNGLLTKEESDIVLFQNHFLQALPVTALVDRPNKGSVERVNDLLTDRGNR